MSITILYVFKNKEVSRVKKSLDSLLIKNQDVEVVFVDYGSDADCATKIQETLKAYEFVNYVYSFNRNQPWSRAKAINIGLQSITTEYVFIADIDIIFASQFLEVIQSLADPKKAYYFKVGFLSEDESQKDLEFSSYQPSFLSKEGAMGMSLFSLQELKALNGFNEFYHFWGAEDEDMHYRLQLNGVNSIFYEQETLLLHQWHPIYRTIAKNELTTDLQVYNIARFNHEHFKHIKSNGHKIVNTEGFGILVRESEYEQLKVPNTLIRIENLKYTIDYFLYYTLGHLNLGEVYHFNFCKSENQDNLKTSIKKIFKPQEDGYYTMKSVNDMILKRLVCTRGFKYAFEVVSDKELQLRILKQ